MYHLSINKDLFKPTDALYCPAIFLLLRSDSRLRMSKNEWVLGHSFYTQRLKNLVRQSYKAKL